jgi:hypothetical protein
VRRRELLAASVVHYGTKAAEATPFSWPDYAAVAIAVISLGVSVAFGLSNRSTARRALRISERQEARRESLLTLHLIEPVAWSQASTSERILGFHILVSNPADRPTSLVTVELHLTYTAHDVLTTVKVPLAGDVSGTVVPTEVATVDLPVRVDANDAVSGWFLFRVSHELTGWAPVERYDVVIRDVHGIEESLQVTVFREVRRGQSAD